MGYGNFANNKKDVFFWLDWPTMTALLNVCRIHKVSKNELVQYLITEFLVSGRTSQIIAQGVTERHINLGKSIEQA